MGNHPSEMVGFSLITFQMISRGKASDRRKYLYGTGSGADHFLCGWANDHKLHLHFPSIRSTLVLETA